MIGIEKNDFMSEINYGFMVEESWEWNLCTFVGCHGVFHKKLLSQDLNFLQKFLEFRLQKL